MIFVLRIARVFFEKTIFITGASSGLGRALAISLSQQQVSLVLMARNLTELQETKNRCSSASRVIIVPGDVTVQEDCQKAINKCIECFGKLDYLILNAGVSMWSSFENLMDASILKKLMDVNYFGMVNCVYPAISYLKQSKGMIIAISSLQGKLAVPYHSGYAASKFAVQGFFEVLRAEFQRAIDILIVSPAWIKDTQLKKNAYSNQKEINGNSLAKQKNKALSLSYCVKHILKAMHKRKQQLILPARYRLLFWLQMISPRLLNFLIKKIVNLDSAVKPVASRSRV